MIMESPYNLLKKSNHSAIKAVEVITDHQAVLYSDKRALTHQGLIEKVEKEIYPSLTTLEIMERQNENVYIFLSEDQAMIHFPDNGKFSLPQFAFVLDFMKSVSRYNHEVPLKNKIPLNIDWYGNPKRIFDIKEIEERKAKGLRGFVRKPYVLNHERVIGETYQEENIKRR